jgi:hypothetical protein
VSQNSRVVLERARQPCCSTLTRTWCSFMSCEQAFPGANTPQQRFLRYEWCTAWCTIIPVLVLLLCFAVALHSLISSPLFLITGREPDEGQQPRQPFG